ncbi:hypothetical protein NDN01_23790 [Sphingomonas sp. QA11]|uniref:hypothetical protein n=1 Tax=Sphingomonas sp. QA11 TaxID=2950605 RepID=UPI002349C8A1|nr:hypothetical protein [Sphingomonas sp. QA11]WCM26969.1 hypothetical protein NDN01_23790 [Sphingomonas sp. QA11]
MNGTDMLDLYGLRIAVVDGPDAPASGAYDLLWRRLTVSELQPPGAPNVTTSDRADGRWTHHVFGDARRTGSEFDVSPDGTIVISRSLPIAIEGDVFSLFAEPVMRSILHRRGLVSLHGATLSRDGRCIMLVGDKGAGKSTLAGALLRHGWSLLTDDLSRLRRSDGGWSVPVGFRQLKLREDAIAQLGYDSASVDRRWRHPEAPGDSEINKYAVHDDEALEGEARLDAIYILGQRTHGAISAAVARLSPVDQLRALLDNMSEDPADPRAAPTRSEVAAAGAVLRDVGVYRLTMPGDIARAIVAAADLPLVPA